MKLEELESSVKMKNLYFSHCLVEREEEVQRNDLRVNIERDISKLESHKYRVVVVVNITGEQLKVEIEACAQFLIGADLYSRENEIIEKNTVAIMFPFIRSQITLMTTQPGMTPIVLPPINVNKFAL